MEYKKFYYKMQEKIYELPLGSLYAENFKPYLADDIISFENISDIDELYRNTDSLFGWVVNSICLFTDDELEGDLLHEKEEIRRRINQVDNLQKFAAKKGDKAKSIALMNELIEAILLHIEHLKSADEPKKGV